MNRFLQLGMNKNGRDFVIGDIHGHYYKLMEGLEKVDFDFKKDRLIAVGDLIDRGKENMEVLRILFQPWFFAIVGNHEWMMAKGRTLRKYYNMWIYNGGDWYFKLDDYEKKELDQKYTRYIKNDMPLGLEFVTTEGKKVAVTHTDTPVQWPWWNVREHLQEIDPVELDLESDLIVEHILWSRRKIYAVDYNKEVLGTDIIVHGHTPSKKRVWRGNAVYIDQGQTTGELIPINAIDLCNEYEEIKNDRMG